MVWPKPRSLASSLATVSLGSEMGLRPGDRHDLGFRAYLTGPKPKEIKVETLRIDCLVRTPKS